MDENFAAEEFWERFGSLSGKDLPVMISTQIKQSTLSTWRLRNIFPRADMAVKIARALNTTVEYLVTGKDKNPQPHSPWAMTVALQVDELNDAGKKIVSDVAKGLKTQYPLGDLNSTKMAN